MRNAGLLLLLFFWLVACSRTPVAGAAPQGVMRAWLPPAVELQIALCPAAAVPAACLAQPQLAIVQPRHDLLLPRPDAGNRYLLQLVEPASQTGVLALRELGGRQLTAWWPEADRGELLRPQPELGWAAGVTLDWPTGQSALVLEVNGQGAQPIVLTWLYQRDWLMFSVERVRFVTLAHACVFAMVLIGLAFASRLRDVTYLLFSSSLFIQLVFFMQSTGEAAVWPGFAELASYGQRGSWFCLLFSTGLRLEFAVRFCELPRYLPGCGRLVRGLGLGLMSSAALLLVWPEPSYPLLARYGNLAILGTVLLMALVTAWAWWRGSRYAGFYLLALLAGYTFTVIRIVQIVSGAPYVGWVEQGLVLSIALSPLILTIGIADHALRLKAERDAALNRATHDGLTGLANREAGLQELERLLQAAGKRPAVAYLDLDHFKPINDRHGHAYGDRVLCLATQTASALLGPRDTLARLGGEEFLLLIPDGDSRTALALCERVREAIQLAGARIEGRELALTISIGLVMARPGETRERVLARADAALYRAKAGGRNRVELDPDPVATAD